MADFDSMNSPTQDEDPWASKRSVKINVFDDNVCFESAKKLLNTRRIGDFDDEDEEALVGWDGQPVVSSSKKNSKQPAVPDLSSLAIPCPSSTTRNNVTHSGLPKNTSNEGFSSFPKRVLAKPEQRDFDQLEYPDSGPTKGRSSHPDVTKLEEENIRLKKALVRSKADKWVKLPVEDTLKRLMKGEPYSFELYKSLQDKLELLDKAIRKYDGNAITAVVMFLKKTISQQIFERELSKRPVAADHYLTYLRDHYDFDQYVDLLRRLGRSEEATMHLYKMALSTSDTTSKISRLKSALRNNFQADPSLASDASLIQEYIDLLENQLPVEQSDAQLEATGKNQAFIEIPRRTSLVNMSVVTTLYYFCLYHFESQENSLSSPLGLRKRHKITDQQFMWTSVSARAKRKSWKDVESLLTTKGWFGGTKLKAVIGFDKIVGILHKNNAPMEVLNKYLALMDDPEQRLNLAKKVGCHRAVIDTFIALKDKSSLQNYTSNLDRYSQDGRFASDVLNSSSYKWK